MRGRIAYTSENGAALRTHTPVVAPCLVASQKAAGSRPNAVAEKASVMPYTTASIFGSVTRALTNINHPTLFGCTGHMCPHMHTSRGRAYLHGLFDPSNRAQSSMLDELFLV